MKRDIALFSNFYFDLRPPGKIDERKPDPRGNWNGESSDAFSRQRVRPLP